jgi:hypothetical protein
MKISRKNTFKEFGPLELTLFLRQQFLNVYIYFVAMCDT